MTKDYAKKAKSKKNKSNTRKAKSKKPVISRGLLIFVLLLIAGFAWGLYQLGQIEPDNKKVKATENKKTEPPVKVVKEDAKKTDYQFHDILQDKEIEVEVVDKTIVTEDARYIMQCGSFLKLEMADSAKAKIAMNSGLSVTINESQDKQNRTWYRVVLGPYKSKRTAQADRRKLEGAGIAGCQIW